MIHRALVGMAFLFVLGGLASVTEGATLHTAILNAIPGSNELVCEAFNLTGAPLFIRVELIRPNGSVLTAVECENVGPGGSGDVGGKCRSRASRNDEEGYCRITVFGAGTQVRAALRVDSVEGRGTTAVSEAIQTSPFPKFRPPRPGPVLPPSR